jgi:nucleoside-diphosphate-sugar epimerase
VVNVGTSHHHTINELLEEIFHVAQWRPRSIDYQLDQPVGVKARAADCTKCESLLGWHPEVSLADGVARTYRWYERARESVRTLDDLLMVR